MDIGIITLFPDMFTALDHGVCGRAIKSKKVNLHYWQPRDFTHDTHHTVDDRPYGGGPGMLMKVQPLRDAINTAKEQLGQEAKVIYASPQGKPFKQAMAESAAKQQQLIFIAGRYEGIDERIVKANVDEEWSVGDYVLSGGELAVMTMIDAITRLIPGVLGHDQSAEFDSFSQGLLDHPHYTRPEVIDGLRVPSVLLSGNHADIARWRMKQALGRTWKRRPDLLEKLELSNEQQQLLAEFINECDAGDANTMPASPIK